MDDLEILLQKQADLIDHLRKNLSPAHFELALDLAAISETIGEYD
jgi:hypothetical protein